MPPPGRARGARVAGRSRSRPALSPPAPVPAPVPVDQLVVVGRVGKASGLRGEVLVDVRTDQPEQRYAVGAAVLTDPPERGPLVVAAARRQSGRLVVHFDGVTDRDAAEALRGTVLLVDPATLAPTDDPDEFHDVQLVGLSAQTADGQQVGDVDAVLHLPHGDVLVVRRPAPAGELLVPFVRAIVPVVDLPGRRLVLDPPEGLLDLPGA